MVPFNQVLKLVARLDSQCLANLPWNSSLSLTRYRGMLHRIVPYSLEIPYILIVPYFASSGKRLLLFSSLRVGSATCGPCATPTGYLAGSFPFSLEACRLITATAVEYTAQYFFASSISEAWLTPPN